MILYYYFINLIILIGRIGLILYGTGSYPLPPHGLQRSILHIANAMPFIGPCFSIACLAYSEQVGVKRQEGGVRGDMHFW